MVKRRSKVQVLAPDRVKKPSGLKNDGTPNASWRKFKERLEVYETVPVAEWGPDQALGHLFKRYSECFDVDFSLSYSGPPTKCSEIYCVKRMMTFLDGETPNMIMVKDFIDWSFDSVIIPKKIQVESLAFFFAPKLVREFKSKYKKSKKITRSTQLPQNIEHIISVIGLDDIVTYGDLAFAKKTIDSNPNNNAYKPYIDLFKQLDDSGFNTSIIDFLEG